MKHGASGEVAVADLDADTSGPLLVLGLRVALANLQLEVVSEDVEVRESRA
jgi:hypothetical protein